MENNTYLNNEQTLANCFGRCLANVIFRLSKKFFFDASTLEALAADGIEYAARIYLNANTTSSLTEKNLTGLANWKAEKLAAEAPVKMLGPLMLCIFPAVFIILMGPVLSQAMKGMF